MDPNRWGRVEALYEAALAVEPSRRPVLLAEQCGGDEALREEVESLLMHGDNAGAFLQVPVPVRPLQAGQQVSHYEIQEKLGEGGMGAVYRAHDSQLRRPVALKVLPPEFAADSERRQRLLREARAASALSHPNIVGVYEVGSDNGLDFIAMEFVEGKTLEELIPAKGLPLPKALDYAVQVAAGLTKAHGAGVIHRDLKPGNIMVSADGLVKLLDFGLARRLRLEPGQETTLTVAGEIAGTPAYMSPEQAEGKPLDARSDVFSFGLVLYRMLTGRQAFSGASAASVMAAVLREEPPALGERIPRDLDKILRRCLRKDPAQRFQHMDDVKVELEELRAAPQTERATSEAKSPRRVRWIAGILAALLLTTAAVVWQVRDGGPPQDLKAVVLASYPGPLSSPTFSPDGNKVAFQWDGGKDGTLDIYVKQIGTSGSPVPLTSNPANDCCVAWSPDDRWLAFLRSEKENYAIMLIPPLGGPERKIGEAKLAYRMSWTPDGRWLVFVDRESSDGPANIWATAVDTGERRRLTTFATKFATAQNPLGDSFPAVSPDGRTLAFFRQELAWIYDVHTQRLTQDLRPDGKPANVTSQEYAVAGGLAWTPDSREIVYSTGGPQMNHLWRVHVSGRRPPKRLSYAFPSAVVPAIALTRPRLAYIFSQFNMNFWRLDTQTGQRKRVIASSFDNRHPQYSPDGRKIAFTSNRSGYFEIWTCDADGANCQQITSLNGPMLGTPTWSPDGRWLAFDCAKGPYRIYVIPSDGGTPRSVTDPRANANTPSWSSDGKWIYFASDLSGRYEIWKAPTDGRGARQITHSGAGRSSESPDGRYLYYRGGTPGIADAPLYRMPAEGGEAVQIVTRIANFSVTAKGVYFTVPGERSMQFRDSITEKVSILMTLEPPYRPAQISASPDDTYVVWSQTDRNTRDLMLVEGFR